MLNTPFLIRMYIDISIIQTCMLLSQKKKIKNLNASSARLIDM